MALHLRNIPNRDLLPLLRLDAPGHVFPLYVVENAPDATTLAVYDDAGDTIHGVLVTGRDVGLMAVGGYWLLAEDRTAADLLLRDLAHRDPYAELSYPLWARATVRSAFPNGHDSTDELYICTPESFVPQPPPADLRIKHLSYALYKTQVLDPFLRIFIGDVPPNAALPPDYPFFVACDAEGAVAMADATLSTHGASAVMGVATAPAKRGRSYAKTVVAHATAAIVGRGHPAVYLVNADNRASIAVCQAVGYDLHRRYGYMYHPTNDEAEM